MARLMASYVFCLMATSALGTPSYDQPFKSTHVTQKYEENTPKSYRFAFSSDDIEANQKREERSGEDGQVRGSYSFMLPDGTKRSVRYIADEAGFRAKIESNEHGLKAKNPADVKLMVSPPKVSLKQEWSPGAIKQDWNEKGASFGQVWMPESIKQDRNEKNVVFNQNRTPAPVKQDWNETNTAVADGLAPAKQSWNKNEQAVILQNGWPTKPAPANQGWQEGCQLSAPLTKHWSQTPQIEEVKSGWSDDTLKEAWHDAAPRAHRQQKWSPKGASIKQQGWPAESSQQVYGSHGGWSANAFITQKAQWASKVTAVKDAEWSQQPEAVKKGWSDDSSSAPVRQGWAEEASWSTQKTPPVKQAKWSDYISPAPLKQEQWSAQKTSALKSSWHNEQISVPVETVYDTYSSNQNRVDSPKATDWSGKSTEAKFGSGSRLERFTQSASDDRQSPNVKLELPHADKIEWFSPPGTKFAVLKQQKQQW
ncbi:uncharacterized protein LOC111244854 isoform X2 [Varroa destructor]|uniref:Uncharacterized protein n=1 Tax=Varroa destructor TaxID=109461 RepID=A0A7M7MAL4_VARDE|nr:uncharacterized protein LOC111244854 isoform X2 [Varroa destructor]